MSSLRTLSLIPIFRSKLLEIKATQERNRELCGNCFNKDESVFIYTDVLGNRVKPDTISNEFPKFLVKNAMRRIRFHDLRHTAANLLLAERCTMVEVRDWLGHSTLATTECFYARRDPNAKLSAAMKATWINKTQLARETEGAES